MKPSLLVPALAAPVLAAVLGGACSAASSPQQFTTGSAGSGGSAASGQSTGGGTASSGSSGPGMGGGTTLTGLADGGTGAGSGVSSAYAHTNNTLFKLDPSKAVLALTQIGNFDCIGGGSGQDTSMTDIAVDSQGNVWGVSAHHVYQLALPAGGTGTVHCASSFSLNVASNATFYGLTFAPVGVLDATKEVLVASNTAGELWEIDVSNPMSPSLTQHGTFGTVPPNDNHGHTYTYATKEWELSGDIVFLANGGNPVGFATVRDCPSPPSSSNCDTADTLVELDLSALKAQGNQPVIKSIRGQIVKAPGCSDPANTSYGSIYGIAAYQDKVFGFSHQGYIVTIDNNDGTACLALSTGGDAWAGAAITTVAPVVPPTTQ
jgi:hypothetical protein